MRALSLLSAAWVSILAISLPGTAQTIQHLDDSLKSAYRSPLGEHQERGGPKKDDPYGRLDWQRLYFGGDFGRAFTERLLSEAAKERIRYPELFLGGPLRPTALGGTSWTNLGPTGASKEQNGITLNVVDSGRLRTILPHPTNPDVVYVLPCGGGLWKTTNFTAANPTWTPTMDQVGSTSGGAAAFGRVPDTVYLGVGDPFDGNGAEVALSGIGGFMLKTTNGAQTWSAPVFLGDITTQVRDVKVDTSTANDVVIVASNTGIFRSTNGGQTYLASGLTGLSVWSLAKSSQGWLATAQAPDRSLAGVIYLSTDLGATWVPVASGGGRITLGIGQPGDVVVYGFASTQDQSDQQDLYRSPDGGLNWPGLGLGSKTPTNPNGDQADMDLMHGQAFYNQMVLVDSTDASRNTVYIGGNLSSAKSTDGGLTWAIISSWLPGAATGTSTLPYVHADFHCAAFWSNGSTKRLFFGSDGGLFVSEDAGATWDSLKNRGLISHIIFALATNPTPGNTASVLVGLQDNGTRLRVGSTGIFDMTKGGDGFGVGWSQANNAWSLGTYVYNDIARCTSNPPDDQSKWFGFTSGLGITGTDDNGASYYFVTPIIGAPASSDATSPNPGMNFFTYGNSGSGTNSGKIFRTTPTGWTPIGTPGAGGLSSGRFVRAGNHGIGVSPVDTNHLAGAGNAGAVLITANGGASWTEHVIPTSGLPSWPNFNVNIAWANNSLLYACSVAIPAGSVRVAKSTDGGTTWSAAATGLPDLPVEKLVVDPGDSSGNTVYAATFLGLYRTTTGGSSWSRFGSGLPQCRVTDIYIAPNSSFLRVATWGRGVWEIGGGAPPAGPAITSQPASQTVTVPQQAAFSVSATGTGTLTYQWKKNGADIQGANQSSFTTPLTTLGDNGTQFSVAVTDTTGTTLSDSATLTVNACPGGGTNQILQNPGFEFGATSWVDPDSVIFTGDASHAHSGSAYAFLGGWPNAKTDSLYQTVTIPSGISAADLSFWLAIINDSGTTGTSQNVLTLKVRNASGADLATLDNWSNLNAAGTYVLRGPYSLLAYQGQTVQVYLTSVQPFAAPNDTNFLVDDFTLNATTAGASTAPSITTQPLSQGVGLGGSVTFTVAATGSPTLYYQWRKNGTVISGATGASYTIPSAQLGDAGSYVVEAANCAGTATSTTAILTVSAISVAINPSGIQTLLVNGSQNFTAAVTGTSNTAVTWSVGGGVGLSNITANSVTYTAPSSPVAVTLMATSVADSSKSASVTINVKSRDLTGDGTVDVLDLGLIMKAWTGPGVLGAPNYNPLADLNGDGDVDDDDINLFLLGF